MRWLVDNITVERSSMAVSLIALLVSVVGTRHAKRSASAAQTQARAAEAQAESAEKQVRVAEQQLHEAQADSTERIAEVSALAQYRSLVEEYTPKIVIGIEPTPFPPEWEAHEPSRSNKYPLLDNKRKLLIFDDRENEYDDIFFTITGIMRNTGNVAAHIFCDEIKFISGETSLVKAHISLPSKLSHLGDYLLLPGEVAIFKWQARRYMEQWINIYKYSHRAEFDALPDFDVRPERPTCSITVQAAGSTTELQARITIGIDENVIRPLWIDGEKQPGKWFAKVSPRSHVHTHVKYEAVRLPTNLEDLRRVLKKVNFWNNQVED